MPALQRKKIIMVKTEIFIYPLLFRHAGNLSVFQMVGYNSCQNDSDDIRLNFKCNFVCFIYIVLGIKYFPNRCEKIGCTLLTFIS